MNSDRRSDAWPDATPGDANKPYEKPAIIWRNAIDTKAISIGCAKIDPGNDIQCSSGSAQS